MEADNFCNIQENVSNTNETLQAGSSRSQFQAYVDDIEDELCCDEVGSDACISFLPFNTDTKLSYWVSDDSDEGLFRRINVIPEEEEGLKKRLQTNFKKRLRNLEMIKAFEELKKVIPNLPGGQKVSKIQILRLAVAYINHLKGLILNDDLQKKNNSKTNLLRQGNSENEFSFDLKMATKRRKTTDWEEVQKEIFRHHQVTQTKSCPRKYHLDQ